MVFHIRQAVATFALITLGYLLITTPTGELQSTLGYEQLGLKLLLLPLACSVIGLFKGAYWSRWLALSAGIAVFPWAFVLTFLGEGVVPVVRPAIALISSSLLLCSLPGKVMFERYEGRFSVLKWQGLRMGLIRWAIICNGASILSLYLFVSAYQYRVAWHLFAMLSLLVSLMIGTLLLSQQIVMGLVVVALCCISFGPAGLYFIAREATYTGEAVLFIAIFSPGILTGLAVLLAFWNPIRKALLTD